MKRIVFFTGAGMSAESGIQTFRDSNGLWEGYDVQEVATPQGFARNPELVLRFYNERRKHIKEAKPNSAHFAIADLQKKYEILVITQNIDDLHERAGSNHVMHLHGEIFKMRSSKAEYLIYPIHDDILLGDKAEDGAQLRPHIVWFNEAVPMMDQAITTSQDADVFVVLGTSLVVYPAASILHYLPPHVPVVVIDKKVPNINRGNVIQIEKSATEGMIDLIAKLNELLI